MIAVIAVCNAASAMFMAWYTVVRLGVSQETDAFFASGALPQFVFVVLSATLLPVLVPLLAVKDDKDFNQDLWSFFSLAVIFFIAVGLILFLTTSVWVPLFVPGFSAAGKTLTLNLMRIQIVSMILNAVIVTLWSGHHARKKFAWVESSGLVANVAGIVFLVLSLPRFGIMAAAWNTVFYNSLKVAFLLPILGYWAAPRWRSSTVVEAWRRLRALVPSHMYLRTDSLLDRFLASMSGTGTLSLLYLSQQVYGSANLLLGKSIVTPMVPNLAIDARHGDWRSYRRGYHQRLILIGGIVLFACVFIIGTRSLSSFLIGHAGITAENVRLLWLVMVALVGVLIGGALGQVTAAAFYTAGNTKTPSRISALVYTFCIPVKIAAFFYYGVLGLAAATSVFSVANFAAQFLALRQDEQTRRINPEHHPSTFSYRAPAS